MSAARASDADNAFSVGAAAGGPTLASAQHGASPSLTHLTQRPRPEEPAKRAYRRTVQICAAGSDGASFEMRRLRPGDEAGGRKHADLESPSRPLARNCEGVPPPLVLIPGSSPGMSKDVPARTNVPAHWIILRQAYTEVPVARRRRELPCAAGRRPPVANSG